MQRAAHSRAASRRVTITVAGRADCANSPVRWNGVTIRSAGGICAKDCLRADGHAAAIRCLGIITSPSRAAAPQFFDGSFHGWTVRGDDTDPEMAPKIVDAFERARDWFLKHL